MAKKSGIELVAKNLFSKVFREYDKHLKKSEAATKKTAGAITKAGAQQADSFDALGAAIGGVAIPVAIGTAAIAGITATISASRQVIEDATTAATDHQAAMAGLGVSARAANAEFGSVVGTANEWRSTVSRLSDEIRVFGERDVAEATARTIDMTKRLGFNADQMEEVVARSADLAAKTGVDLTGAVERVTAAMRGEAESSEFLGLTLSETFVKTNALRLGFEKTWKDMSDAEKAQVRYALFLEQTAAFTGTAAASTDTLAGAQAEYNARLEDANVALGKAMIPLTTEWTRLKANLADKVLVRVAMALTHVVGLIHGVADGAIAMAQALDIDWTDILLRPVGAAADVIIAFATGSELADQAQRDFGAAMLKTMKRYSDYTTETERAVESQERLSEPLDFSEQIKVFEKAFDKLQDLERAHGEKLVGIREDYIEDSLERDEDYLEDREDLTADGLKKIADLESKAGKKRAKTIASAEEKIADEQADANDERLDAQRDYERRAAQSAEDFALDRVQSERDYQFERKQLVAEGDVLAIRELDERYALEQKQAEENQALQEKQAKANFDVQLADMKEASRDVLNELGTSLDEQLAEQDAALAEQLDDQRIANIESLAELDERYVEEKARDQRRYAEQLADAEDNYRRQLELQGRALADQLREQDTSAEETEALLDRFFGDAGITDEVMAGFHEREDNRIAVTGEMLGGLSEAAEEMAQSVAEAVSLADAAVSELGGFQPGTTGLIMDEGGVVTGPANVRVGSGVTEMFMPLGGNLAGNMNHSWRGNPIPLAGLEKATPESQTAVANALVRGLIAEFEGIRAS